MKSMQENKNDSYLFGSNAGFIEELYEKYLSNPSGVDDKWKKYFDDLIQNNSEAQINHTNILEKFANLTRKPLAVINGSDQNVGINQKQLNVFKLIDAYRRVGHLYAKLDPLQRVTPELPYELKLSSYSLEQDLNSEFYYSEDLASPKKPLKDIIKMLEEIYCTNSGFEFSYLSNKDERDFLTSCIENQQVNFKLNNEQKLATLQKLVEAETLEKYLHTRYVGAKRFSLEGGESLIPALDRLIKVGSRLGVKEVLIGMAHRGRLNTLVNILGKTPKKLFDEFEGNYSLEGFTLTGDVKYHKGYKCNYITESGEVKVTLAFNPSHLEVVNPVINGMARATQDSKLSNSSQALGVLIHGDSAIIGLGTNQGTFSMSYTRAYNVAGMVHIIVNNQVGFTNSDIRDNRSSRYCSDIAKMIEAPVIHVNADKVESVIFAIDLAIQYRTKFKKDIVIDLVCFRKYGHNEADDPTLTQPFMYKKIKAHPGVRSLYANCLVGEGVINDNQVTQMVEDYRNGLTQGIHINAKTMQALKWYTDVEFVGDLTQNNIPLEGIKTSITQDQINEVTQVTTTAPQGFKLHQTLEKLLNNRKLMGSGEQNIDFGMAETLAYGSLLMEGVNVRLTGEDSGRGTFSHRLAVWHDMNREDINETGYLPLNTIANKYNSRVSIYDSILNEECVLGFEYGYSITSLDSLVIWEAQFGDFANGAQVIIDQFISSGEAKWGQLCNLTLMLPHGYDGQGPEHSSARIERFLQLCAANNMQVVVPTTAAQMFHLLRLKGLNKKTVKPLVIFMSKRLLRLKDAASPLQDFTEGKFYPLLIDNKVQTSTDLTKIKKLILTYGQIYYDLVNARTTHNLDNNVAIIRIEQLYPTPIQELSAELTKYSNLEEVVWVQDEPYNQGAWLQLQEDIGQVITKKTAKPIKVVTRPIASAPATGMTSIHEAELKKILTQAFE